MEKIEASVGYTVSINPPIVDDTATAEDDSGVSAIFNYLPFELGDYWDFLCTIEINGVVHVYRELHTYEETDDYAGFVANGLIVDLGVSVHVYEKEPDEDNPILSEGDEVKLLLEPVSVKLSDAFRAAVKKAYIAVEVEPVDEGDAPVKIDLDEGTLKPIL